MKFLTVLFWSFIFVYSLFYLYLLVVSRKPFKFLLLNAFCGWWCFAVFEFSSFFTGLHIPLNPATVIVSGVLGVPGTILIEVMKYCIFI